MNQNGTGKHELVLQFDEKNPLQFNSHQHWLLRCKIGSSTFIQGFSIDFINFTYNVFRNKHVIKQPSPLKDGPFVTYFDGE